MKGSNSAVSLSTSRPSSKRLLFDKRYGWIYDEWKDPSEEALAGGRGMFCILPIGRALLHMATQSIDLVRSSTVTNLQRLEQCYSKSTPP